MSRISCDVTKDLLPPYLDEICSKESKELVEEHLRECASCQQFLKELKRKDQEKEAHKVDYLKKVRRSMDIRALLGVAVPVLFLLYGAVCINQNGMGRYTFYYFEMPILMLLYAFALGSDVKGVLPTKKEWLIPACGLAIVGIAMGCYFLFGHWMLNEDASPVPHYRLGPYLHWSLMFLAAAAIAMLAGLVFMAKKKARCFLVSQNLAWLALNLALALDNTLYTMETMETLQRWQNRNMIVLAAEFVLVTLALALFYKLRPSRLLPEA